MTAKEAARASRPQTSNGGVFEQLEAYPWDTDPEFQSGLQAILSQSPSPDQAQQLTLRARCFYFARYATAAPFGDDANYQRVGS